MAQSLRIIGSTVAHKGQRLDLFLTNSFPDYSRTYFQELIASGGVTVNGHLINKVSYKMTPDQTVQVLFPEPKQYSVEPIAVSFQVIDEQEDFIVINKPAGLLVHAASTHDPEPTLVNGLMHYFGAQGIFNPSGQSLALHESIRPGIIHRLDKETSGLLLVARTLRGQLQLSNLFKERSIKKEYLAVVQGNPPEQEKITLPIGRDPVTRHKMAPYGLNARKAVSIITRKEFFLPDRTALIEVSIETGRTHQIRVHCAARGYSVVGDKVYGKASLLINRQALHAYKLSFNYNQKIYSYTCDLPDDIFNLITYYKKRAQDYLTLV